MCLKNGISHVCNVETNNSAVQLLRRHVFGCLHQFFRKIIFVHKYNLVAVRIQYRANLCAQARDRARFSRQAASSVLDLCSRFVNIFCRYGNLGVCIAL
jgi:hypothetical protein